MYMEKTLMELNMSFLMKDDELLKNTMKFEKKVINGLKKEFDSQPIYNI